MENDVINSEYRVSEFEESYNTNIEKEDNTTSTPRAHLYYSESIDLRFSLKDLSPLVEVSEKSSVNLFEGRDVILNEKWEVSESVQGKVVSINESGVYVDCLIDVELKTFQHRSFPINLFKHISGLSQNKSVIIKTRLKAGAIRIDVFNGEGIVNDKLFKQKDSWDSLVDSGLDEKLTKW